MKIVDLSVAISEDTPVYPGDPKTVIKPAGVLAKDGFCDHFVSMGTHVGTHIDAPMHMLEGGSSLDQQPTERFIGRGVYVDVADANFAKVKDLDLRAGDIVVFATGMSKKFNDPTYFENYPAMDQETAKYLAAKNVSMVGVDTCSVDNKNGFPVHKVLLGKDILIIENLTNLEQLADADFKIYALPIKLQVDGAPARVIAEMGENQ